MNDRQQKILSAVVKRHIKTAEPISSKFIAENEGFDLSSATIRNELAELEKLGYISHPHTSAGRIPTEKGYCFFVENFLSEIVLPKKEEQALVSVLAGFRGFEPRLVKELAKIMAEFSSNTVFAAFAENDFYYTGISNLFSQPEFADQEVVCSLSRVIDHFDGALGKIYEQIHDHVDILIGRQNPFSSDCSLVVTKFEAKGNSGVLGILGPIRMDYKNNVGLIEYSKQLINQI